MSAHVLRPCPFDLKCFSEIPSKSERKLHESKVASTSSRIGVNLGQKCQLKGMRNGRWAFSTGSEVEDSPWLEPCCRACHTSDRPNHTNLYSGPRQHA